MKETTGSSVCNRETLKEKGATLRNRGEVEKEKKKHGLLARDSTGGEENEKKTRSCWRGMGRPWVRRICIVSFGKTEKGSRVRSGQRKRRF